MADSSQIRQAAIVTEPGLHDYSAFEGTERPQGASRQILKIIILAAPTQNKTYRINLVNLFSQAA